MFIPRSCILTLRHLILTLSKLSFQPLNCPVNNVFSLFHGTFPGTSMISFSEPPNFTTPHLSILGSMATAFRTCSCVFGEQSNRIMKWCPLSCNCCPLAFGFARRKGPQFVIPRIIPPDESMMPPAIRAILGGVKDVSKCEI